MGGKKIIQGLSEAVAYERLRVLIEACRPFVSAHNVALDPRLNIPDDAGLRDVLPGVWPTAGDLRRLAEAIRNVSAPVDEG